MPTEFPLRLEGFEPIEKIGSGGFGAVWLARQTNLDRNVAIKVGFRALTDPNIKRRFERECVALGRLSSHTGIVDVHSSGVSKNDLPYIVMEYVPGGSLADRLGLVSESELRIIGDQICSAIQAAHDLRIFHRDLKPANVFLRDNADVVIGDFGIARLGDGNNTTSNQIVASVAYAPPEILDGGDPTVQADVYGIGVTLAALAVGRSPFTTGNEDTVSAILKRVFSGQHVDLTTLGLPSDLAETISNSISINPVDRPSTAQILRDRLTQPKTQRPSATQASDRPTIAATTNKAQTPPVPVAAASPGIGSRHAPPSAYTPGSLRSDPNHPTSRATALIGLAAGVVAVFLIAASAVYFLGRDNDPETAAEDASPLAETITPTSQSEPTTTPAEANPSTSTVTPEGTKTTSPTSIGDASSPITPSESAEEATGDVTIRNQQEVKFAAGTSSATLEGAVIRAERDLYVLEATAGQTMSVDIRSFEDNASFTIVSPTGQVLASETDSSTVVLPADGNYEVIVGPSRGNATYSVTFQII